MENSLILVICAIFDKKVHFSPEIAPSQKGANFSLKMLFFTISDSSHSCWNIAEAERKEEQEESNKYFLYSTLLSDERNCALSNGCAQIPWATPRRHLCQRSCTCQFCACQHLYWILHTKKKMKTKKGRPTKLMQLLNKFQKNPRSSACQVALSKEFPVSAKTINRTLLMAGYHYNCVTPQKTLTENHMVNRHEFAISHAGWTVSDWGKVVFTDEKFQEPLWKWWIYPNLDQR